MKKNIILMFIVAGIFSSGCMMRVLHPASYTGVKPGYKTKTVCKWVDGYYNQKVLQCKKVRVAW